jgi:hypothetical protein
MKTSNKILLIAGCVPVVLSMVIMIATRIEMKYYTDNDFTFSYELYGLQRARDMEMITEEEYDAQKKELMGGGSYDIEETDLQKARAMEIITEEEYNALKK